MKIQSPISSTSHLLKLLDFCRGLAIIGVFSIHYPLSEFKIWFGWQGVHIFLILSAFGLTYSRLNKNKNSWKEWFIKRAARILPCYWLVVLIGFLLVVINLIINYIFKHDNLVNLIHLLINTTAKSIIDILLLRNFFVKLQSGFPNPALWFVPFIISFYLIFPWLYNQVVKSRKIKDYILVLLVAASVEFIYRAISIYWFHNIPIAYVTDFLPALPKPELISGHQIPFGFFPSRIAEFVLGMIGAILFVRNQNRFENFILNIWVGVAGLFICIAGDILLHVGLWGWVFSDFVIAVGLILFVINLAVVVQQNFSPLFRGLSKLGDLSYYIYLCHFPIFFFITTKFDKFTVGASSMKLLIINLLGLGVTIIVTGIASWGLMQFDKSKYASSIIPKLIAKLHLTSRY